MSRHMFRIAPLVVALCALPGLSVAADALTPAAVNSAEATAGDTAILRAQVLLDRALFSPGEIDGGAGSNTTRAIRAFQRSRDLDASGELDAPTWQALNAGAPDVLIDYTIAAEDVAGPFAKLPEDTAAKAGLPALGFESALELLGEKFHASPKLLQRLNPDADFAKAGTTIVVPNVAGVAAPGKAAKVVVDKSDSSVAMLDAAGKVMALFPASTGSEHDPLPVGEWKIQGVARDPKFHYNPELFWDAEAKDEKATLAAGPNNPVGVVWIDLSKPHYGIHGTPEPSKIGKTESHGCIRLTNWSAKLLSDSVAPGTPAVLQE
ncbi:L,D-transpeptidase family protein [Luteimonas notoginsengisoli]|uniref:L,D-transpeptidase family protein n=1 Tax=Luteimonas notoginsengisoli TaxID=1578200 RepID=A0ABV7UT26_9GAMM